MSLSGNDISPMIGAMTEVIRHRGPDDEGFALVDSVGQVCHLYGPDTPDAVRHHNAVFTPTRSFSERIPAQYIVALGHRRLSILDLSPAGHQPMSTEDGRYLIVYNGEIYNYMELRKELTSLGHHFLSQTDTEVCLAAFRQWGADCLDRFNGMFAFLIYDVKEKCLFAARDRFGIKPLYYWFSPNGFLAFASEIKQFIKLDGWAARLNHQMAYDFLNWGLADHTADTLFRGVRQFPGGEFVHCKVEDIGGELPVKKWYRLRPEMVGLDFNRAAERFLELFQDSVRLRLRADVDVGTGLSGGLDSSSIVCTINHLLKQQGAECLQNTFSAASDYKKYDERPFLEEVVRHTRARSHIVVPTLENLQNTLDRLTWHQDEPFSSLSIYAEWNVFQLVSTTATKVTLDGHGADELLAGYHAFFGYYYGNLLMRLQFSRLIREIRAAQRLHGYTPKAVVKEIVKHFLPSFLAGIVRSLPGTIDVDPAWIRLDRSVEKRDPYNIRNGRRLGIRNFSISQLLHTSLPVQLHWADRDSMAFSIESRVPFLDYRLVEFVLGCPEEFKIQDALTKRILRKALKPFLPEKIYNRTDKMGFVTPEETWIRKHAPDSFRQALQEAVDNSLGVLAAGALSKGEAIIAGREPFRNSLWRMISFGRWMRLFSVEPN
ncbi:MAG: asparagine synthase (glutamine-hydrolyzing) [Nitrospina sp.]|nr:asparagine synthase (glutamine-hydrolyzing) [Nitrospina sp.]